MFLRFTGALLIPVADEDKGRMLKLRAPWLTGEPGSKATGAIEPSPAPQARPRNGDAHGSGSETEMRVPKRRCGFRNGDAHGIMS